jgi:hypothetical protein
MGDIILSGGGAGSGTTTVTGTVTANQGTPNSTANRWPVQITDGTDLALVTAAGEVNVLATAQPGVDIGDVTINNGAGAAAVNIQDGGNTITVDGTVTANQGGAPWTVTGTKTSNTAGPDANNVGVLPAVATAAAPSYTEGNQVAVSTDLAGATRITGTITANAGTNLNTSTLALETTQSTGNTRIGDLTEAAPATDTASSGLNGRLQRIAQRLTSIIALLPAALVGGRFDINNGAWLGSTAPTVGSKTSANSIPVVIASDQGAVSVSAAITSIPTGAGQTLQFATISQGAAGTTTLVTADATRKIKVVSYVIVISATGTAKFIDSTPTDLTGAMPIAINGGVSAIGTTFSPLFATAVNKSLQIVSTTGAVTGHLSYFLEV